MISCSWPEATLTLALAAVATVTVEMSVPVGALAHSTPHPVVARSVVTAAVVEAVRHGLWLDF